MKNEDCNNAIKEIFPKININQIKDFINQINYMSEKRKEFYINIIEQRYIIIESICKKIDNMVKCG